MPSLPSIMAVAAGDHHTIALTADGQLMAWGSNRFGQLGNSKSAEVVDKPGRLFNTFINYPFLYQVWSNAHGITSLAPHVTYMMVHMQSESLCLGG